MHRRAGDPPVIRVHEVAYRYSSYDTPFWVRENTEPGRWHARGDGPTQYLSLSAEAAWAELIRKEELRTEDEVAMVSVPMWAVAVDQAMVVDYASFESADAAGFDPAALVEEDYSACQREGARLRGLGYGGIVAPSAAFPGETNLTLFGPRVASTWNRPPLLASSLPATMLTKGAPPPGLLARVRPLGSRHAGLEAYRRSRRERGTASPDDGTKA